MFLPGEWAAWRRGKGRVTNQLLKGWSVTGPSGGLLIPSPTLVSRQHMTPAVLSLQGTPARLQVRPMNPARLRTGRRSGEGKTSRPNPSPGDTSPGAENQVLGNDLGAAQSSGNMFSGCHCLPQSQRIFHRPQDQSTAHTCGVPPTDKRCTA